MAKHLADSASETSLQKHLERYLELNHLRVRMRGDLLILEAGPKGDPFPHARFRRDTVHLWRLEMPTGEDATQVLQQLLLALADLHHMDLKFLGNLVAG